VTAPNDVQPVQSNRPDVVALGKKGGYINVKVWKKPPTGDLTGSGRDVREEGVLPLHPGDYVRIAAGLDAKPAHIYIVWLNTEGKLEPVWPWDEDWKLDPKRDVPRKKVELPKDIVPGTEAAPLTGGPRGIESVMMLVRDQPLPPGTDVRK